MFLKVENILLYLYVGLSLFPVPVSLWNHSCQVGICGISKLPTKKKCCGHGFVEYSGKVGIKQNRTWMIVTTNQRGGGKSTEIYPTFNLWRMTGGWFLIWHTPVDYFKLTPHVVVFGKNGEKPGSPNRPQHFRSLPILNHNKRYQNMWPVKNTPVSHMASHTSPFSPGIFFLYLNFC